MFCNYIPTRKVAFCTFVAVAQMSLVSSLSAQEVVDERQVSVKVPAVGGLTRADLEAVIRANYENVTTQGTEKDSFIFWTVKYTPPVAKDDEVLNWNVLAQVTERPGQAAMARIWFECTDLPQTVDSGDLQELLLRSGGHPDTRAYFKTYVVNNEVRRLALVVDVPPEDATKERFPVAVNGLFKFAYDTSFLWGRLKASQADQDVAMTEKKDVPDVKLEQLAGRWKGDRSLNGKKNGEWAIQLAGDGFMMLSRVDLSVAEPKTQVLTGQAKVAGATLILTFHNGQPDEKYEAELQDVGFTLTSRDGKEVTRVELTK